MTKMSLRGGEADEAMQMVEPLPLPRPMPEQDDLREEEIETHADQDQVAEEEEGPAHIVADDLALVAHEAARGHAHARRLGCDRLADLGPHRVERRQQ